MGKQGEEMALVKVEQAVVLRMNEAMTGLVAMGDDKEVDFGKVFKVAEKVRDLRALLAVPGVMDNIMPLMNTSIGFRTDRPNERVKTPYSVRDVAECTIVAASHGALPVGNEFNMLAGNCYLTKGFYGRHLRQMVKDGAIREFDVSHTVPKMDSTGRGALLTTTIRWQDRAGEAHEHKMDLGLRVNSGQGVDALWGKADRRAYHWLHDYLTGRSTPSGDVDSASEAVDVVGKTLPDDAPETESRGGSRAVDSVTPAAPIQMSMFDTRRSLPPEVADKPEAKPAKETPAAPKPDPEPEPEPTPETDSTAEDFLGVDEVLDPFLDAGLTEEQVTSYFQGFNVDPWHVDESLEEFTQETRAMVIENSETMISGVKQWLSKNRG